MDIFNLINLSFFSSRSSEFFSKKKKEKKKKDDPIEFSPLFYIDLSLSIFIFIISSFLYILNIDLTFISQIYFFENFLSS